MSARAIKLAELLAGIRDLAPELKDHQLDAMSRFPHVIEKIIPIWGTAGCAVYLQSLTIDQRGNRQGFPANMLFTIHDLIEMHDAKYPEHTIRVSTLPFTC